MSTSQPESRILPMTDNLRAVAWRADDNPKAVFIYFQARSHEEPVSFRITTSARIISSMWEMPSLRGGHWLTLARSEAPNHFCFALNEHRFLDLPFMVGLELETDANPQDCIAAVEVWDKSGGEAQVAYVDFGEGK